MMPSAEPDCFEDSWSRAESMLVRVSASGF